MRLFVRKLAKRLFIALSLGVGLFVLTAAIFAARCSAPRGNFRPLAQSGQRLPPGAASIPGYSRTEDDTFLTYPEWYIVWSYQEKADYQQHHLPSGFPYFGAIQQYWGGYCYANEVVHGKYPFNMGDHLMLVVIGTSFSVEYFLKGFYENTIGRLSEWLTHHEPVEEDNYSYRVAKKYGDFVQVRPFYEFPFFQSFRGLWSNTSLWGPHALRKWERKAWLSLDYGIEAVYCGLIEIASHAVYGVEPDLTYVWMENTPRSALDENPHVRKVKDIAPEALIAAIPRYQEFTETASRLVSRGVRFQQIAGNEQVLVTVIAPRDWKPLTQVGELLFASPILTEPGLQRVALRSPVPSLHILSNYFADQGLKIEHIYDY
jgi:hypothetical protein